MRADQRLYCGGARFDSSERIGGRADPFAPIDQPGIAGTRLPASRLLVRP
jgi:hypothetical protein